MYDKGPAALPGSRRGPSRTALGSVPVPRASDVVWFLFPFLRRGGGHKFPYAGQGAGAKCCTCSLHSHWLLTYPALQKGGTWVLSKSAMERGRFTPQACRVDYRLRPCVPGCLTLRVQRPEGATLRPDPRPGPAGGAADTRSLTGPSDGAGPRSPGGCPGAASGGVHGALKAAVTATTTRNREKVPRDDEQAVAGL